MMRSSLAFLGVLVTLTVTPASAQDSDKSGLHLQPASEWKLREYEDKCRISRVFGEGENRTTLWIDKGGPGPSVNLTLIGRPMHNPFGPNLMVRFGPGDEIRRNYLAAESSAGRPVVSMFGVQPLQGMESEEQVLSVSEEEHNTEDESVDLINAVTRDGSNRHIGANMTDLLDSRINRIETLRLARALREPVTLKLDGFGEAVGDLVDCTKQMVAKIRASGRVSKGVVPKDQATWAKRVQEHYPTAMLREEKGGSLGVRLTVNTKGKATFCEVIEYDGPASFNDPACLQLLRYATFEPAQNTAGEPVVSFFSTRIIYRLNR